TPWGCLVLGVVQPPGGAWSWVWSNPLGVPGLGCGPTAWGVSRHPPGTAADPPRARLRQWVAVSAASETACRRAAVHLPACSATGGPARRGAATRSQHSRQLALCGAPAGVLHRVLGLFAELDELHVVAVGVDRGAE